MIPYQEPPLWFKIAFTTASVGLGILLAWYLTW